jgi:hypothetical protein
MKTYCPTKHLHSQISIFKPALAIQSIIMDLEMAFIYFMIVM